MSVAHRNAKRRKAGTRKKVVWVKSYKPFDARIGFYYDTSIYASGTDMLAKGVNADAESIVKNAFLIGGQKAPSFAEPDAMIRPSKKGIEISARVSVKEDLDPAQLDKMARKHGYFVED